jgi:hypothetical protein
MSERQALPCFVCDNTDDTGSFSGDHTEFDGSPGYGSRFDMTGHLRIFVCDDCLEERKDRVHLVKVERVEPVVPKVTVQSWACEVCGTLAHEGECHVERTVSVLDDYPLGSEDDPELERFLVGVPNEDLAKRYLESYRKHAHKHGLDEAVQFRMKPTADFEGRWTVYAVVEKNDES